MSKLIHRSHRFGTVLSATCVVLMSLLCISAYADIPRTWKIHDDTIDDITNLTSGANTRLYTKDREDDLRVCATITKGATDTGWTFSGDVDDDGKVLSAAEETAFDTAAAASGKNSFRLVEWNVTGSWCGWYDPGPKFIGVMDSGNAGTLAHEVGHVAGCGHNTEGKTHRIMYQTFTTHADTVNSTERDKYEVLD